LRQVRRPKHVRRAVAQKKRVRGAQPNYEQRISAKQHNLDKGVIFSEGGAVTKKRKNDVGGKNNNGPQFADWGGDITLRLL